jgi:hypothetical protein
MYCTADSCAETCDTQISHTNSPRNNRVLKPRLLIRFRDPPAFNPGPFNFAKPLPLQPLLSLAECVYCLRCSDLPFGDGLSRNERKNRSGGPGQMRSGPPAGQTSTVKLWRKIFSNE